MALKFKRFRMFLRSIFLLLLLGGLTLGAAGHIPYQASPTQGRECHSYLASPPKGWECIVDEKQLPQKVKAIFVGTGHGNSQFTPSINIASESTQLSLKDYVAQAKSYHEGRAGTRCALLGNMATAAGSAEMLQIDRPSQWGDIRFVQAMLLQDGEAYVVTATCLKQEFSAFSSQIFKAIQSFSLPPK